MKTMWTVCYWHFVLGAQSYDREMTRREAKTLLLNDERVLCIRRKGKDYLKPDEGEEEK